MKEMFSQRLNFSKKTRQKYLKCKFMKTNTKCQKVKEYTLKDMEDHSTI